MSLVDRRIKQQMNKRDERNRKWQKNKSPVTKRAYQQKRNIVNIMLRSAKGSYNK